MKTRIQLITSFCIALIAVGVYAQSADWVVQFGSSATEFGYDSAADASGVYVGGRTYGGLPGKTLCGPSDAYIKKYDVDGNELWAWESCQSTTDNQATVSLVAYGGDLYAGFSSEASTPDQDTYNVVRKFDTDGNVIWEVLTNFSASGHEFLPFVSVDDSGVYQAGYIDTTFVTPATQYRDLGVVKYDHNGNELWRTRWGDAGDELAHSVIAVPDALYLAGSHANTPGQDNDFLIVKLDADGNEVWSRQFGTSAVDLFISITADESGIYAAGYTLGDFGGVSAGDYDAVVVKYDYQGNELWRDQFGTSSFDGGFSVRLYAGAVYVAGYTAGSLEGANLGGDDLFVRRYTKDGAYVDGLQFGTAEREWLFEGLSSSTHLFLTGTTFGTFPSQTTAGDGDAFLARLNFPPLYDSITGNDALDAACPVIAGVYTDPVTGDQTHGTYVSCIANKVAEMRNAGIVEKGEGGQLVKAAARSDVNR